VNERDYKRLRRTAEERLEAAKQEYDEQIKALEKVWALARAEAGESRAPRPRKGAIRQAVLDVVIQFTEPFGVQQVIELLQQQAPDVARATTFQSLATVLRRLRDEGKLTVDTTGTRTAPTMYVADRTQIGTGTQH
jgi:hypothetical protein